MVSHWCCPSPGVFTGPLPEARLVQRSRVEDSIPCARPPPEPASQESSPVSDPAVDGPWSYLSAFCWSQAGHQNQSRFRAGDTDPPTSQGESIKVLAEQFSLKALFLKKKTTPISKDVLYHLCHRMSRHKCVDLSGGIGVWGLSGLSVWPGDPAMLFASCLCCCSVAQSCPNLCDPGQCSRPGFPVLHHLRVGSNSCPLSR